LILCIGDTFIEMDATAFCIVYIDQLLSLRSLTVLGPSIQVKL